MFDEVNNKLTIVIENEWISWYRRIVCDVYFTYRVSKYIRDGALGF